MGKPKREATQNWIYVWTIISFQYGKLLQKLEYACLFAIYFEKYIVCKIINSILMKSSLSKTIQLSKHKSSFGLLPFLAFPFIVTSPNPFSIVKSQIYIQSQMNLIIVLIFTLASESLSKVYFQVGRTEAKSCPYTSYNFTAKKPKFVADVCPFDINTYIPSYFNQTAFTYCQFDFAGEDCSTRVCWLMDQQMCLSDLETPILNKYKHRAITTGDQVWKFGCSKCNMPASSSCNNKCFYFNASISYNDQYHENCLISTDNSQCNGIPELSQLIMKPCSQSYKKANPSRQCSICFKKGGTTKSLRICLADQFHYDHTLAQYLKYNSYLTQYFTMTYLQYIAFLIFLYTQIY